MRERENVIENTTDFDISIRQIILEMDFRRKRKEPLDGENIKKKIYSLDYEKPGEYLEFMEAHEVSDGKITPELALEMADIIYYTSQPNCPNDIKILATDLEEMIGIDHKLAQRFCILKYRCRLEQPISSKNHKEVEYQRMSEFLNNKKLNFLP